MTITTTFDLGDKAWAIDFATNTPRRVTIGWVRVETDERMDADTHHEHYMARETGIGTGTLYTLDEDIFETERDCAIACAANDVEDLK